MYAITGITGQVGGATAERLLAVDQPVRAIVRNREKAGPWVKRGCELALADFDDEDSLARAFTGTTGVLIVVPPSFDPRPGFPEAHATAARLLRALQIARPEKVVYLSTIGADATEPNLLTQHTVIEQSLRTLPIPITFLRPAWFLENFRWDIETAEQRGVLPSFLQPLDHPFPMVAAADIGETAARLLTEEWTGQRTVGLEGPSRLTPDEAAATFTDLLGRAVRAEAVPRETWEALFRGQGMQNPGPRIRMVDGFNEGWIDFANGGAGALMGKTTLREVLRGFLGERRAVD